MHVPVLLRETLEGLNIRPDGVYVDATLGGAGHAEAIAGRLGQGGCLIGLDRDPAAVERAARRLDPWRERIRLRQGSFAEMGTLVHEQGVETVDGVLMDLGISSWQLDDPSRGFGFQADGPLDMRMDPTAGTTAAAIVNGWPVEDLAALFRRYGEEPRARAAARGIAAAREQAPIETTARLAEVVSRALGGRRGRLHPATRVFQALRIEVNDELGALRAGLREAIDLLAPGGRLAVIAFHSLEDRLVKEAFRRHAGRMVALQQGGERWEGEEPRLKEICRKPVFAGEEEVQANPRARSARLRVAERMEAGGRKP